MIVDDKRDVVEDRPHAALQRLLDALRRRTQDGMRYIRLPNRDNR